MAKKDTFGSQPFAALDKKQFRSEGEGQTGKSAGKKVVPSQKKVGKTGCMNVAPESGTGDEELFQSAMLSVRRMEKKSGRGGGRESSGGDGQTGFRASSGSSRSGCREYSGSDQSGYRETSGGTGGQEKKILFSGKGGLRESSGSGQGGRGESSDTGGFPLEDQQAFAALTASLSSGGQAKTGTPDVPGTGIPELPGAPFMPQTGSPDTPGVPGTVSPFLWKNSLTGSPDTPGVSGTGMPQRGRRPADRGDFGSMLKAGEKAAATEEADDNEFAAAMRQVTPLSGKGRSVAPPPDMSTAPAVPADQSLQDILDGKLEFVLSLTGEYLEGHTVGLDEMTMGKLRAGSFSPEAYLDLHGLNAVQAFQALLGFVRASWFKGLRTVLVVPGRGLNSPNGYGILRDKLQLWLTQEPFKRVVLAFCTAIPTDGGPGSVYVLLRKYKKKGRIYWERMPIDPDLI